MTLDRNMSRQVGQARRLRQRPTPAELVLWKELRNCKLNGLKFRRQHPIGRYIVDFCCVQHKLVVEVDGDSHAGRERRDEARTRRLEAAGYRVIRFTNREVLHERAAVLAVIMEAREE